MRFGRLFLPSAHISSGFAFRSTFVVVGWLQCNSIERCNYAASSCNHSILWPLQPAHFMRLHHVQARTGSALLAQLQDDWTNSPTTNSTSIALWCVLSFTSREKMKVIIKSGERHRYLSICAPRIPNTIHHESDYDTGRPLCTLHRIEDSNSLPTNFNWKSRSIRSTAHRTMTKCPMIENTVVKCYENNASAASPIVFSCHRCSCWTWFSTKINSFLVLRNLRNKSNSNWRTAPASMHLECSAVCRRRRHHRIQCSRLAVVKLWQYSRKIELEFEWYMVIFAFFVCRTSTFTFVHRQWCT